LAPGNPFGTKNNIFLHNTTYGNLQIVQVHVTIILASMKSTPEHCAQTCTASLKLLGDFWTLSIIDTLKGGEMRYCDLQRAAGDVNPVTLGNRLRKLQEAGLIDRCASQKDIAVSYRLTDLGFAALPVLEAVDTFSRRMVEHSAAR